jgi:hypothetical protein
MGDSNVQSQKKSSKAKKEKRDRNSIEVDEEAIRLQLSSLQKELDTPLPSLAHTTSSENTNISSSSTKRSNNHLNQSGNDESKANKRSKQEKNQTWNFQVDYNDHFETPLRAYEDVLPVLDIICKRLQKERKDLVLYDPYYCQGSVVGCLQSLQFPQIINRNRDFYRDIKQRAVPNYDVLITNPPFSGEHKQKLLTFIAESSTPYLLLLPAYVVCKAYWKDFVSNKSNSSISNSARKMLYILPPDYYHYQHPEGTGKAAPPFYSAWLIGGLCDEDIQRYTTIL